MAADWKTLANTTTEFKCSVKKPYPGNDPGSEQGIYFYVQYDANSITPTSVNIRFRATDKSTAWKDQFYVVYNANNIAGRGVGRTVKLIKGYTGIYTTTDWSKYASGAITITKAYDAESFYLEDFWICNNGNSAGGNTTTKLLNAANNYEYAYNYFNGDRKGYVQKGLGSKQFSLSGSVASSIQLPGFGGTTESLRISDNGNNTFTIRAFTGKAGTNNSIISNTLYYKSAADSDWLTKTYSEKGRIIENKAITINYGTNTSLANHKSKASQDVNAYIVVEGKYNTLVFPEGANKANGGLRTPVAQYVSPTDPGKPNITFKKNRLTVKEPWRISWTRATETNTSSPVEGYRLRIYKKAKDATKFETIEIYDTSGTLVSKDTGSNDIHRYAYDTENTDTAFTINPADHDINVGDTIKIGLCAYSKDKPISSTIAVSKKFSGGQIYSEEFLVQNSGIMHIKVDGKWREGQVFIKVDGKWREAENVQTKVNGEWREAQ